MSDDKELTLEDAYAEPAEVAEGTVETAPVETKTDEPAEPEVATEDKPAESTTDSKPPKGLDDPRWDKQSWMHSQAMDEREKRQKWEHRALDAEGKLTAQEPVERVSVLEDEEAWSAQQDQLLNQRIGNEALNMSQALAEREFGTEVVDEAVEWFKEVAKKSPYMLERFNKSPLKHHEIIRMRQEEIDRAEMSDMPALKAKMEAEIRKELQAEADGKKEPSITPSLASARASGSEQNTDTESWEDMLGE